MKRKSEFKELQAIINEAKETNFEKIDKTAHELVLFFVKIQDRLNSEDDRERTAAVQDLDKLQKELDAYSAAAAEKSGMSPQQLHQYLNKRDNFTEEEWERLQKAQDELKDYEQELIRSTRGVKGPAHQDKPKPGKKGRPKPPRRPDWLSG
jgi:HD superfamily phosphodiesterase